MPCGEAQWQAGRGGCGLGVASSASPRRKSLCQSNAVPEPLGVNQQRALELGLFSAPLPPTAQRWPKPHGCRSLPFVARSSGTGATNQHFALTFRSPSVTHVVFVVSPIPVVFSPFSLMDLCHSERRARLLQPPAGKATAPQRVAHHDGPQGQPPGNVQVPLRG